MKKVYSAPSGGIFIWKDIVYFVIWKDIYNNYFQREDVYMSFEKIFVYLDFQSPSFRSKGERYLYMLFFQRVSVYMLATVLIDLCFYFLKDDVYNSVLDNCIVLKRIMCICDRSKWLYIHYFLMDYVYAYLWWHSKRYV